MTTISVGTSRPGTASLPCKKADRRVPKASQHTTRIQTILADKLVKQLQEYADENGWSTSKAVAHIVHTFFNPNPAAVEPAATPDAEPQGTLSSKYEGMVANRRAAPDLSDDGGDGDMAQMLKLMKMMKAMKEAGIEL